MNHPFVVKLHYAFQTKNKIYLIVDLMSGVIFWLYVGRTFLSIKKKQKVYLVDCEVLRSLDFIGFGIFA